MKNKKINCLVKFRLCCYDFGLLFDKDFLCQKFVQSPGKNPHLAAATAYEESQKRKKGSVLKSPESPIAVFFLI